MRIIEPHVHVWALDTERYPWAPGTASPPRESATAEELHRRNDLFPDILSAVAVASSGSRALAFG